MALRVILGGTFNPPHYGHITPALYAADLLGVEHVDLMPCKLAPHKSVSVSETHRVNMIHRCCDTHSRLRAELIELSLPSPSYTVKTLRALNSKHDDTICFLIGADSLYNLDKWYEWESLLTYCHLIVMRRDSETFSPPPAIAKWLKRNAIQDIERLHQRKSGHVLLLNTPLKTISSTQLRNEIASENADTLDHTAPDTIESWVPLKVIEYINDNQLYSE